MKAPRWAQDEQHERSESKAARLAALYLSRDRLAEVPKTSIAETLGVSRWTLDRDLASLDKVAENVERLVTLLA